MVSVLAQHSSSSLSAVHEMLIVVPDMQAQAIASRLSADTNAATPRLPFPVTVVPESTLFDQDDMFVRSKYALQMALKLLCARLVHTPWMLTMDADLVLLRPLSRDRIFESVDGRGFYDPEPRHVHADWWLDSARLLGLYDQDQDGGFDPSGPGFGVTPAVLSTPGALEVLEALRLRVGATEPGDPFVESWLRSYGEAPYLGWSEYTLYRLLLDHVGLFDTLHAPQRPEAQLHCYDVWTAEALPWDALSALRSGCLFSVLQGTVVDAEAVGNTQALFLAAFVGK